MAPQLERYNEDGEPDPRGIYDADGEEIDEAALTKDNNRQAFAQRRESSENKRLKEELATLQRERAFEKAGIDPADKKFSYFIKGYEGDLTADAVKAAAIEVGLMEAAPAAPDPATEGQNPEVLGAQQQIVNAATGATTPATGLQGLAQEQLDAFNSGSGNNTAALLDVLRKQGLPIADGG